MATLKFGTFTAIPGVRMEKTKSNYAAKDILDTTTVADLGKDYDSFGSQSYTDFFPGLNLRWNATPSLVLRAAVTRAIGRAKNGMGAFLKRENTRLSSIGGIAEPSA